LKVLPAGIEHRAGLDTPSQAPAVEFPVLRKE
jgi:hypothetical protein